ncbi:hypothetical protein [Bacillus infantis]|uniref:hypothetical protein n=1 Tax=Bacillus infantis TaxID=324767 RepID=UPI003CED3E30
MSKQSRDKLFLEARDKGLTITWLSEQVGCSVSMLSRYFRNQANLSKAKEEALFTCINNSKKYEWKRVEVK